jgi:hypothetical protein
LIAAWQIASADPVQFDAASLVVGDTVGAGVVVSLL